ncbi:MAG: cell division protein FtsX [Acidimicrobiia bacterium]
MSVKFGYFARETLISLRRNLLMTLAGILTITVSLFLFGGILLLSRLVAHGTDRWKGGVEAEIFLNVDPDSTQAEKDAIQAQLADDPEISSYEFFDHEAAYEEFQRLFEDDPNLVEAVNPEALPESFRITFADPEDQGAVAAKYESEPGVSEVATADEETRRLLTITGWVRRSFITLSLLLLLSALFLIVNTIRLATFARRREIEVMKLVGASNWFVRVPFMAEGVAQGLLGAGLAIGGVAGLYRFVQIRTEGRSDLFEGFFLNSSDLQYVALLVLAIGLGIGAIGSIVGLRRFLRV